MTQTEFARRIDVAQSFLSALERGFEVRNESLNDFLGVSGLGRLRRNCRRRNTESTSASECDRLIGP
jgi:transcriptional regulator with XRE-family HTH domain